MTPKFLWSIRVLYVVGLLALLDLTIIIPTSVSYFTELLPQDLSEDEKERKANFFFGLALSLFSLAQAIVGIFGGYIIALLGFKKTFVALLVFTIIGDTLYALSINPIVAIAGRTISGIGSANLGMVFTYIAMVTSDAERHSFMSIARLFSVVGLVFSPGFVYVLSKVDFTVGGYKCTQLNAAGWITDILCVILIIVIIVVLQEVERPKPKEPEEDKRALMSSVNGEDDDDEEEQAPAKKSMPRLYMSWAVVTVFVCSFYNGFTGTSFEFMVTPICQSKYDWTPSTISLYLLVGSLILAPVILIVMRVSKVYRTTERFWIILALILSMVGIVLSYLGTQGRFRFESKMIGAGFFAVGQTVAMCAYMVLSVSLMPLSSKIVPPESRQVMVPWVNSCLAAGRLVGPMWTQWTYAVQDLGENTEALFGSIMAVGVVCIAFCVVFWKHIIADSWRTLKSTTVLFK